MNLRDGKEFVIALDFDGTTCFPILYPDIGEPRRGVINFIKQRKAKGNTIVLFTCREGKELDEALSACETWGITPDLVNENAPWRIEQYNVNSRKISADLYIEDKAVHPDVLEVLYGED